MLIQYSKCMIIIGIVCVLQGCNTNHISNQSAIPDNSPVFIPGTHLIQPDSILPIDPDGHLSGLIRDFNNSFNKAIITDTIFLYFELEDKEKDINLLTSFDIFDDFTRQDNTVLYRVGTGTLSNGNTIRTHGYIVDDQYKYHVYVVYIEQDKIIIVVSY